MLQRPFVPRGKAEPALGVHGGAHRRRELRQARRSTRCPTTQVAPSPVAGRVADRVRSGHQRDSSRCSTSAGPRSIRGDVQLIPIGDTIFYVRPIYVEGQGAGARSRACDFVARHVRRRGGARSTSSGAERDRTRSSTGDGTRAGRDARRTPTNPTTIRTTPPTTPDQPTTTDDARRRAADRRRVAELLAAGGRRELDAAEAARSRPATSGEYQQPRRPRPRRLRRRRPTPGPRPRPTTTDGHRRRLTRPRIRARPGLFGPSGDCYYLRSVNSRAASRHPGPPPPGAEEASPMAVSGIDLGKYKLGWHDTEQYVVQAQEGPQRGGRPRDLVTQVRARVDDEVPAQRAEALRAQADARVVREEHARHRLRRHLLLPQADRGQVNDWDMLPEEMKATYEKLGIPEAERKFLAGVTAQYESEVVYHKNREDLEALGHHLHRHGHRAARVPGARAAVLRRR